MEHVSRFVAWLRAPADNVTVLVGGSGRCGPATVNKHLAALFSFYDYQARNGVVLAQSLVAWRRVNRGGYRPFLHHVTARPTGGDPAVAGAAVPPAAADADRRADADAGARRASTCGTASCWSCWRRPACGSGRRWGCGTPISSPTAGSCGSCRGGTTRTVPARKPLTSIRSRSRPGLVRLYTAYMFDEYGECDSDYVFVNLFAEPYGRPLRYQAVHQLVRRLRARTGIDFTLHMLRHSRATDLLRARGRRRRGRPAAHPPLVDDHLADLRPPGRRRPAGRADPARRLGQRRIRR